MVEIDFATLLAPLWNIMLGFGVLIGVILVVWFVAIKIAEKRQAKWLEKAVKEAVFQSTPAWINRRNLRRIK